MGNDSKINIYSILRLKFYIQLYKVVELLNGLFTLSFYIHINLAIQTDNIFNLQ